MEYSVSLSDQLALELENDIFIAQTLAQPTRRAPTGNIPTEFLVKEIYGIKIEVFANEHPPPHFRVKNADGEANYRIFDCKRLNGSGKILKCDRVIQKWWKKNKSKIIDAWNEHRPTDCPVGKYREG